MTGPATALLVAEDPGRIRSIHEDRRPIASIGASSSDSAPTTPSVPASSNAARHSGVSGTASPQLTSTARSRSISLLAASPVPTADQRGLSKAEVSSSGPERGVVQPPSAHTARGPSDGAQHDTKAPQQGGAQARHPPPTPKLLPPSPPPPPLPSLHRASVQEAEEQQQQHQQQHVHVQLPTGVAMVHRPRLNKTVAVSQTNRTGAGLLLGRGKPEAPPLPAPQAKPAASLGIPAANRSTPGGFGAAALAAATGAAASRGEACAAFTPDEWYSQVAANWGVYMGEEEGTDYRQTYRWLDTLKGLGGAIDFAIDVGAHAGTFSDKVRWRFPYAAFALLEADPNLVSTWLVPGYARLDDTAVFNRVLDNVSDAPVQLFGPGGGAGQSQQGAGGGALQLVGAPGADATQSTGTREPLLTSRLDDVIPLELTPPLRMRWESAQSVFLKVDTEGMDELVLRGFDAALSKRRGKSIVQLVQLEFSPAQMREVNPDVAEYNLNSTRAYLEAKGFAVFWIGPNFVPLTHGAWTDKYLALAQQKPETLLGPEMAGRKMATDLLAIREDYPLLPKLRQLLGSCAPKRRTATLIR